MGLFSRIIRAFRDTNARIDADIAAKETAKREREYWEMMREISIPWDSRRHFCLNCAKAAGDLPLDYDGIVTHPSTIMSLAHLSHEDRRKAFQKIRQTEEKLRGSKSERPCDIHQEMLNRGDAFLLQGTSNESSRPRIDDYCIDCGKEQGEVAAEENEYSLPLKPSGLQLIGDRVLVQCTRHVEEWRKEWHHQTQSR